jgi:hypothetical protein
MSRNSLPDFKRTRSQLAHVKWQLRTARLVRGMWRAAPGQIRRDPDFLQVLLYFTWENRSDDTESTLIWRNRRMANWLGVADGKDKKVLAKALQRKLPQLGLARSRNIVRSPTGLTTFYGPFRPGMLRLVRRHAQAIGEACYVVSQSAADAKKKILRAAEIIDSLPHLKAPGGGTMSPHNGLSPLLACLDPQRRFPIMNNPTRRLLRWFGNRPNAEGAATLVDLIGKHDIHHAFDLDVYFVYAVEYVSTASGRAQTAQIGIS